MLGNNDRFTEGCSYGGGAGSCDYRRPNHGNSMPRAHEDTSPKSEPESKNLNFEIDPSAQNPAILVRSRKSWDSQRAPAAARRT